MIKLILDGLLSVVGGLVLLIIVQAVVIAATGDSVHGYWPCFGILFGGYMATGLLLDHRERRDR